MRRRIAGWTVGISVLVGLVALPLAADEILLEAAGWHDVDDGAEVRGLHVRFCELGAEMDVWSGGDPPSMSVGKTHDVTLTADWETHSVSQQGATFEIRLRGTGSAVGAELEMSVRQAGDGQVGGQLEAEDEQLLGAWVEVASARLLSDG